jgi:hypothetical protein
MPFNEIISVYSENHHFFIHFPLGSQLEHRAPFGVSVITHTIRHTAGLLWTSDQPVAETLPIQDNTPYKHKRQTSMPSAGFEPAIPATKRPQTYALRLRGYWDRHSENIQNT